SRGGIRSPGRSRECPTLRCPPSSRPPSRLRAGCPPAPCRLSTGTRRGKAAGHARDPAPPCAGCSRRAPPRSEPSVRPPPGAQRPAPEDPPCGSPPTAPRRPASPTRGRAGGISPPASADGDSFLFENCADGAPQPGLGHVGVRLRRQLREEGLGVVLLELEDLRRRRGTEVELPLLRLEFPPGRGDGGGGRIDAVERRVKIPARFPDPRADVRAKALLPHTLPLASA